MKSIFCIEKNKWCPPSSNWDDLRPSSTNGMDGIHPLSHRPILHGWHPLKHHSRQGWLQGQLLRLRMTSWRQVTSSPGGRVSPDTLNSQSGFQWDLAKDLDIDQLPFTPGRSPFYGSQMCDAKTGGRKKHTSNVLWKSTMSHIVPPILAKNPLTLELRYPLFSRHLPTFHHLSSLHRQGCVQV